MQKTWKKTKRRAFNALIPAVSKILPFILIKQILNGCLTSVFYHMVTDRPSPFTKHLYLHRSIDGFKTDLEFFSRNFTFVGFNEILDHFENGTTLPSKAVFISFDDGHREMFDVVAPLLEHYGIPATFFIIAGALDNKALITPHKKSFLIETILKRETSLSNELYKLFDVDLSSRGYVLADCARKLHSFHDRFVLLETGKLLEIDWDNVLHKYRPYMTTEQISNLSVRGFHIGAHGVDHTKFMWLTQEEREKRIIESLDVIYHTTGEKRIAFSFPNSHSGVDHDWMHQMIKKEPRLGYFVSTQSSVPNKYPLINRINMESGWDGRQNFHYSPANKIIANAIIKRWLE